MPESAAPSDLETRRLTRRYWRRVGTPSQGWWPGGALLLLGLLATFLFGLFWTAPAIEAETRERVERTLEAAGYPDLVVEADGQEIHVRGDPRDTAASEARIASVARGAGCDTWLANDLVCPNSVRVTLGGAARVVATAAAPAPAPARAHDFRFQRDARGIHLEGEVADAVTRERLVAAARARFATVGVTDDLRITNARADEATAWAVEHAWPILGGLSEGGVAWEQGRLRAWGRTTAAGAPGVRAAYASDAHPERLAGLELQVAGEDVARCNEAFARTLAGRSIRFRTGSARISAESQGLIAGLAAVAERCPIALDVEGHTDDVGSQQLNLALSLARAQAVVAALESAGVDGSRLRARGYGPSRAIADNATPEGRAQNRRIEIKASAVE